MIDEHLTVLVPDPTRRTRTIAGCHARLARRRRRLEFRRHLSERSLVLERALVAGGSALYLLAVARDVWRVFAS